MKEGTENNVKFKKLKRRLGFPEWQVIGLLESIWKLTRTSAQAGDIGRFSNEDIAASIEYKGDPDELINHLTECGWLDEDEQHRLVVHDWSEHVPNYIKGNFVKHGKSFVDGSARENAKATPKEVPKETRSDTRMDASTKSSQVKPSQAQSNQVKPSINSVAGSDVPNAKEFFDRWNSFVEDKPKLKKVVVLGQKRRDKLRTRLRTPGWFSTFQSAIKVLPLLGDGWQPDFDWFIKNDENAYLIIEGKYDWRIENASGRKLAEQKRKNAAKEREERIAKEKAECQRESVGTREAMQNIFDPKDGGGEESDDSSLLFG